MRVLTYFPAVQDCPKGYPLLAAFLDSDDNFMIYRRFGYLQARLLLEKQDQLRRLEWDLDLMDEEDKRAQPRSLITFETADAGKAQVRQELMQKIEEKFRDYGGSIWSLLISRSLIYRTSLFNASSAVVNSLQPAIFD